MYHSLQSQIDEANEKCFKMASELKLANESLEDYVDQMKQRESYIRQLNMQLEDLNMELKNSENSR